jgi:hypothetical protein
LYKLFQILKFLKKVGFIRITGIEGDWGLGIGDWGLGPIPNPQSPIPNPQSPNREKNFIQIYLLLINNNLLNRSYIK